MSKFPSMALVPSGATLLASSMLRQYAWLCRRCGASEDDFVAWARATWAEERAAPPQPEPTPSVLFALVRLFSPGTTEVVALFGAPELAIGYAARRDGAAPEWRESNGHGRCWMSADGKWLVDEVRVER